MIRDNKMNKLSLSKDIAEAVIIRIRIHILQILEES